MLQRSMENYYFDKLEQFNGGGRRHFRKWKTSQNTTCKARLWSQWLPSVHRMPSKHLKRAFEWGLSVLPVRHTIISIEMPQLLPHWMDWVKIVKFPCVGNRNQAWEPYETFCTLSWHQNTPLGPKRPKRPTQEPAQKLFPFRKCDERNLSTLKFPLGKVFCPIFLKFDTTLTANNSPLQTPTPKKFGFPSFPCF